MTATFPAILREIRKRELWHKLRNTLTPDQGLYVYRDVLNGEEIQGWAKDNRMTNLLPANELHVTIVHSSHAIPWALQRNTFILSADQWLRCQGLGDKGAVVAMFESSQLSRRWQEASDAGAIWDYASGYQPHVTLSYDSPVIPTGVPDCDIVLGPEHAEALDTEWAEQFRMVMGERTKAPLDLEVLPALARLADQLAPALRRAFLAAVAKAQGKIDLEALAAAIEANQLTAAEAAVKIGSFAENYGGLAPELRAAFLVGSGLAIRELAQSGVSLSFNLINPYAVQYAETHLVDLVTPFKADAKELIAKFVSIAVSGETTPQGAAKDIKDLIGLDARRVQAADNFWRTLVEQDVPDKDIARRVGKYMDSLLRQRAEVIARTETMRAANAGQREAWNVAAGKGLIDKADYVRVWKVTWDERLCDECEPLDDTSVGMDEEFDEGDPPLHPNCRCTINLEKAE